MTDLQERFICSFYGLVIGDTMGVPFNSLTRNDCNLQGKDLLTVAKKYSESVRFPLGTFSDDTALTLATMDAISDIGHFPQNKTELNIVMAKFSDWLICGEYTQDGVAWDVGKSTRFYISEFLEPSNRILNSRGAGNGSLMRILPAVFAMFNEDIGAKKIEPLSSLTHPKIECEYMCIIYTLLLFAILKGKTKTSLLSYVSDYASRFNSSNFRIFDIEKYQMSDIKSSGYVVDTLEAAVWCFLTTNSFDECLTTAISLGGDTDTITSIACGLAGAYYKNYNKDFLNIVRKKEMLEPYVNKFLKILN